MVELVKKYDHQSDEAIRALRTKMGELGIGPDQEPDECFLQAARCRAGLESMRDPITDRFLKNTIMQGVSSEDDIFKLCVYHASAR